MTDTPPPDDRPPVDYRELLEKYILHVIDQEGTDFLFPGHRSDRFSDEEWAELVRVGKAACGED